ncbi:MAG: hypothetical protein ACE5GX_20760, partial [Thermoanaerobaculia bacterium]
ALLVVHDDTASSPPRALHAYRKTLSRDHLDFCHGLLDARRATRELTQAYSEYVEEPRASPTPQMPADRPLRRE